MSIALSPTIALGPWPRFRKPGLAVAKVGAAVAVLAGALGFAVVDLGTQPVPEGHAIVTPAPHRSAVPGNGPIPVLQLPRH